MKRILYSLLIMGIVGGAVFGATQAFFSDTETSEGNLFQAGVIDLKIDNESYYNGQANPLTSWILKNLTIEKFFDFFDLKPGDYGEDTISVHVGSNEAYLCGNVALTSNDDNGLTEPEEEDGDITDGAGQGELADQVNFLWWADDGDNVLEEEETILPGGPLGNLNVGESANVTFADSSQNIWGSGPIEAGQTYYIGKAWCFGDILPQALPEGNYPDGPAGNNDQVNGAGQPEDGGFTCTGGSGADNQTQTDSMTADIFFYAVQARNNEEFVCEEYNFPTPTGTPQKVGANLGAYDAPETCDLTVDDSGGADHTTVGDALEVANQGDTVCVEDGIYPETVDIEIDGLTLASVNGPTNTATIDGGVIVDADDVTVKGFIVIPGNTEGSTAGFYLKSDLANVVIRDNEINGTTAPGTPRGILNTGSDFSNIVIENNYIHDNTSGIYINPVSSGKPFTIRHNDIDDNVAGIGNLNGALVVYNKFDTTSGPIEAIGAGNGTNGDYDGSIVMYNNFLGGTEINAYTLTTNVNAPNNFFGPSGAAVQAPVDVNYAPEAGSAYDHI